MLPFGDVRVTTQAQKAHALRRLHHAGTMLLLPNAWDAASAALFARRGFAAIATTSGGMAWSLGYADGECMPLAEVLAAVRRIARVVELPLSVDFESGYADAPPAVGANVRAVIEAGAVGINLEDSLPGHGPLRSIDESAARIRAARAAADEAGVPIVINARVDAWLQAGAADDPARLDDALRRAQSYMAAGADCIFPIGLAALPVLQHFVRQAGAPVSVAAGPGMPDLHALGRMGVARVSTATRFAALALSAVDQAATEFRAHGRGETLASGINYDEAQRLFVRA